MITTEKEIEDILIENPEIIEDGLTIIGRQVKVGKNKKIGYKIPDLLGKDKDGNDVIIEIKSYKIGPGHIIQIVEQIECFNKERRKKYQTPWDNDIVIRGILVAPYATAGAFGVASDYTKLNISIREIKKEIKERIEQKDKNNIEDQQCELTNLFFNSDLISTDLETIKQCQCSREATKKEDKLWNIFKHIFSHKNTLNERNRRKLIEELKYLTGDLERSTKFSFSTDEYPSLDLLKN